MSEQPDDAGFSFGERPQVHAFLQWRGTDACFDFYCDCGEATHFDGYFARVVKCGARGQLWQMPFNLFPRKVDDPGGHTPVVTERDDD